MACKGKDVKSYQEIVSLSISCQLYVNVFKTVYSHATKWLVIIYYNDQKACT